MTRSDLALAAKKATLLAFDRVLGLGLETWAPEVDKIPPEIEALAQQRQAARGEKRWKEADALREQLLAAGYGVEDTPAGARIRKI